MNSCQKKTKIKEKNAGLHALKNERKKSTPSGKNFMNKIREEASMNKSKNII